MTIEEIEQLAERVAGEVNPRGLSPFPFDKLSEKYQDLKIYLSDELPEEISGLISYDKSKKLFEIVANKNKAVTRQQFTLAHEVGHYFLHKNILKKEEEIVDGGDTLDSGSVLFREDSGVSSAEEIEANRFAAALLMPRVLLAMVWGKLESVDDTARVFSVSPLALTIRLQKLGLLR